MVSLKTIEANNYKCQPCSEFQNIYTANVTVTNWKSRIYSGTFLEMNT